MIVTDITSEIFERLKQYQLVKHYGFAEMLPDGDATIPAVYCSNGEYKHVINDYEWTEGIAYIRYNGAENTTLVDEVFIGCQDLLNTVFPMRLVVIGKRKGQKPYDVASLIKSKITGMYEGLAQAYGAVYVDITAASVQYDIRVNLNSEFDGADIAWDTELYIISVDLNIEVRGDATCLDTTPPCGDYFLAENDLATWQAIYPAYTLRATADGAFPVDPISEQCGIDAFNDIPFPINNLASDASTTLIYL